MDTYTYIYTTYLQDNYIIQYKHSRMYSTTLQNSIRTSCLRFIEMRQPTSINKHSSFPGLPCLLAAEPSQEQVFACLCKQALQSEGAIRGSEKGPWAWPNKPQNPKLKTLDSKLRQPNPALQRKATWGGPSNRTGLSSRSYILQSLVVCLILISKP